MTYQPAAALTQAFQPPITIAPNGTVIPPTVSPALAKTPWDVQSLHTIYAAQFGIDPNSFNDQSAAIQAVLVYAYQMRAAMNLNSGLDDVPLRQVVRVILPPGQNAVANLVVVPPFVSLETQGTIWRRSGGTLTANPWLPTVAFATGAHAMGKLNVNATDDLNVLGSGVIFGVTWNYVGATIATAGTGYAVGDTITFPLPQSLGLSTYYQPLILTVVSIGTGGTVATFSVTQPGYYPMPGSVSVLAWGSTVYSNTSTLACKTTTSGAGTGFTAVMTDEGDFAGGEYRNNSHSAAGAADTLIGEMHVRGCGFTGNDPTRGHQFAVCLMGMNTEFNLIQTNGGYVGIYVKYCPDMRGNKINPCQMPIGLLCRGAAFSVAEAIFDSATLCSILSLNTIALSVTGRAAWYTVNNGLNGTYGSPAQSGYQVIIGSRQNAQLNDNIYVNLALSAPGPVYPYYLSAIAIAAGKGGSGWAVGNTFNVVGVFDPNPDLAVSSIYFAGAGTVTAVSGGAVTAATVLYGGQYPLSVAQAVTAWGYAANAWPTTAASGSGTGLQITPTLTQSSTAVGAFAYLGHCLNTHINLVGSNQTFANYTSTTFGPAYGQAARFCDFGSGVAASCTLKGAFDGSATSGIFGFISPVTALPTIDIDVADNSIGGTTACRVRSQGLYDIKGQGTPVNGTSGTGVGKAVQASTYIDALTGNVFVQSGAVSSPYWVRNATLTDIAAIVQGSAYAPQQQAGRFYGPDAAQSTVASFSTSASACPYVGSIVEIGKSQQVKALACEVSTYASTFNIYMAIYADLGGFPYGAPLVSSAVAAVTATGVQIINITSGPTLAPGVYWVMMCASYLSTAPQFRAILSSQPGHLQNKFGIALSQGGTSASNVILGATTPGATFAAPPTISSFTATAAQVPICWIGF